MATINLVIRKNKTNSKGKAPIRLRIRHKNKVKEVSLPGAYVDPLMWDNQKQRVKGDKMLNLRIENKLMKYKQIINQFEALESSYSLDDITLAVKGNITEVNTKDNYKSAIEYIEQRFVHDPNLVYGTRKLYSSLIVFLKDFKPRLKLEDISGTTLNAMEKHLIKAGYASWTVHSRLKCVKRVANRAFEDYIIEKPDWRGFKMKKGKSDKKFLSKEELQLFIKHQPKTKLDQEIRRAFLFSCFGGGLRFGDLMTLTYENIRNSHDGQQDQIRLKYTMNKTNNQVSTNLNQTAISFLDHSKLGTKEMVFHILPYEKLNESYDNLLKAIESKNAYSNKRLKQICEDAGLKRKFSFHEARHTFICLGIQLGIDYLALKELAGFSNVKVLSEHYAKVIDETKNQAMNLYDNL